VGSAHPTEGTLAMAQVDAWYEAEIDRAKLEEKITIALNLLRKNVPLETISEATGLSIKQLQQLRSSDPNER
jgi:hypothetical protein